MGPSERRQKLLEVLCARSQDTYRNLAQEFQVCQRTIRYDIEALMCFYPIYTVCGRYGGVRVTDGFYLNQRMALNKTLNEEQRDLLLRMKSQVTGKDIHILDSILAEFAP